MEYNDKDNDKFTEVCQGFFHHHMEEQCIIRIYFEYIYMEILDTTLFQTYVSPFPLVLLGV